MSAKHNLSSALCPSGLYTQSLCLLFFCPIPATFPALLIVHANDIWWKEHNMKSISKQFSPVYFNCTLWCPNIFLSNRFAANVLPRSMTDQGLHSYKIAGKVNILDFKLLPCSKCCMLSSGLFTGVWILYSDVSEHSVYSIFIGRWLCEHDHLCMKMEETECFETSAYKIQTPVNNPEESIIQNLIFLTFYILIF